MNKKNKSTIWFMLVKQLTTGKLKKIFFSPIIYIKTLTLNFKQYKFGFIYNDKNKI